MKYKCMAKCTELDSDNSQHCVTNNKKECPLGNIPIWINQNDITLVNVDDKLKEELIESIQQLYELFGIAYDLNKSENTRTAFSQKTTTYLSGIIQTLQYINGQM